MARHNVLMMLLLVLGFSAITPLRADSLQVRDAESLRPAQKPRRSPMGALMRSVAAPGWGQFYNHKYLKAVVVCGVESFFIVKSIDWWRKTERQYDKSQELESGREFNIYLNYRDHRNDYLWAVGISVFISMFDAYVDAHLAGFDVDLTPDFQDKKSTTMLRISYQF